MKLINRKEIQCYCSITVHPGVLVQYLCQIYARRAACGQRHAASGLFPGSNYPAPGTWHPGPKKCCWVPGPCSRVVSTRYPVPGTKDQENVTGSRVLVPG
jgi:hypothetical protein